MGTQDVVELLQQHTKANVTEKFMETIQKLVVRHENDKNGFVEACGALGKFQDAETVLSKVFDILQGISQPNEAVLVPIVPVKKKKLNISFDDSDDSDDDIDLLYKNPFITKKLKSEIDSTRISFKKIKKNDADRLKQYAKVDRTSLTETIDQKNAQLSLQNELKSNGETRDEVTNEEKDWYNFDDDYGNPVSEEIDQQQELDSDLNKKSKHQERDYHSQSSTYQDALHSEIQLNILSTNIRKKWLPQFLIENAKTYNINSGAIIGSIVDSTERNDMVNPFRNPESEFSVNARKGSKLVNMKRLQREQNQRSKENTTVEGTKIGNVLGLKDSKKDINQNKSSLASLGEKQSSYKENIKATRESLPSFNARSHILSMIRENQVSIIIGETGSGKTTQLAQYMYEDGFTSDSKTIGITQPRRVAAMSVAKRVALEMNVPLGDEVGYSIRFEDQSSSKTRIKFMTDGILLREVLLDNMLEKYSCIIIDEAHERSLNTDVLLGILKSLLRDRKDLKLIITSATMNAAKFSKFFGNAPQLTIPGRTFPVQINYSKFPVSDYVESAIIQAVNIHVSTSIQSGDILIFMTGQEDIDVTTDMIKERLLELYIKQGKALTFDDIDDIEIYPIYSALPTELQNRIFRKLDTSKRKVVIATNIAETSLTIDGIKYVIDCGYSKLKVYNHRIGLDSLAITPIALANANQRSGRAGRTGPGVAYRLYTDETAESDMYSSTIPEIQRTNLSNTVLLLKSLEIGDIFKFPFMDSPPIQTLLNSLYELWSIGAIDNFGGLTGLGREMSKFPLQPSLSKILLNSIKFGCSSEILIIVSMLSIPQVFRRPKEREKESDQARSRFFIPQSDHLTLLNVYLQWENNNFSSHWCEKHFVQYKSLIKARDIRDQLLRVMKKQNMSLKSSGSNWDIIRQCICTGFGHQAAKISGLAKYVHLRTGMDTQIHPTSALYGLGDLPPYIVYNEMLMTSTEYLVCVTAVDPFWLMDSTPLLYDIKKIEINNNLRHGLFSNNEAERKGNQTLNDAKKFVTEKLESCISRREIVIDKLEKDNLLYSEKKKQKTEVLNKRSAEQNRNSVRIGFKKRRPFI